MKSLIAATVLALLCTLPASAADLPGMTPETPPPAATGSKTCMPPTEAKCRIELPTGISMAYWEAGPADGPVIIFLHGLTDTARSWAGTMAYFQRYFPKYRLIALDQRGHGETSMPPGKTCPASPKSCFAPIHFAADLRAFMNAKGIEKATIAGHSMGSIIAQQAALDMPERVESIVLVATTNASKDNAIVRDYVLKEPVMGAWKKGLDAKGITSPEAVWNATPLDADPAAADWIAKNWTIDIMADPALTAAITPETARTRMGTWIGATEALLEFDNTARLASLTVPTLVIWGTQDAIFYKAPDQDGIIAALKASKAKWFWKQYGKVPLAASGVQDADIGHNTQWEVPDAIGNDIAAFIATGSPSDTNSYMVKDGAGWKLVNESGATIVRSE
jgi:pimeloyl-ACP methyl ester carboxylesterase